MINRKRWAIVLQIIPAVFFLITSQGWAQNAPLESFKQTIKAGYEGDWGAFWDGCEESTQQTLGRMFLKIYTFSFTDDPTLRNRLEERLGPLPQDLGQAVLDRDMFIKLMDLMWEDADPDEAPGWIFSAQDIQIKELKDDRAVIVINGESDMEEWIMVRRGDQWKLYMDPSQFSK